MSTCQNCKKEFAIETEDLEYYKKISVPPPTFCPECRLIRRFMWRNERFLYRRACDLCKADHLSNLSPESGYIAYCPKCWWSDNWDPTQYASDYDFSKPFFEQFRALMKRAPQLSLWVTAPTLVNSEYNNLAAYLRNCYMVFHADNNEDSCYATGIKYSKFCVDATMIQKSEYCYQCVNIQQGYENFFSVDCESCRSIYFSKDCVECSDCVGCVGLRKKRYHIFNQPYSKEEYAAEIKRMNLGSRRGLEELRVRSHAFWLKHPVKYMRGRQNLNSSGDYVYNAKNTKFSYELFGSENCKYCQFASVKPTTDCYDYTEWGMGADLVYESITCGQGVARIKMTVNATETVSDCEYSTTIVGANNIFGCVGVRKKNYCILNKEYSPEAYKDLLAKIKQHMNDMPYTDAKGRVYRYGEFFPFDLSPYGYNEATGQQFFPLSKDEAVTRGYPWRDVGDKPHVPTKLWQNLPDTIAEVPDEITKEVILCKAWSQDEEAAKLHGCSKAFRITPQELRFYRRYNIPLPTECHNTRHYERSALRAPIAFWHRQCMCPGKQMANGEERVVYANTSVRAHHGEQSCPNEFETSYAPDRPEIIYCEQCYQAEVA